MQTLQAYIFNVLQYFATKLGNFTNFNMLFLAAVKDFDFFAKMNIQFKRGMVHFQGSHKRFKIQNTVDMNRGESFGKTIPDSTRKKREEYCSSTFHLKHFFVH